MTAPRIVLFCVTLSVVGCGSGGPQTDTVVSQDELAVAINYPLDSAEFISPNVVDIFVDASDTSGAVNRIEFYANGALLGSDTSEPFGYRWMSPPNGTYDLTAVAYDEEGNSQTSERARILVESGTNARPKVSLSSPSDGLRMTGPGVVTMTANATDADGQIVIVDFLVNGYPVGSDDTAPFTITWFALAGEHALSVVATDNNGALGSSGLITIEVENGAGIVPVNAPPTTSLTEPTDGAEFVAPADVRIEALASDTDGSVERVDFYADSNLIGSVDGGTTPYLVTWRNAPVGMHRLYAVAIDDGADVAISEDVSIVVSAGGEPPPVNAAPTVAFRQPAPDAHFIFPNDVDIEAVATDSDGSIARVDFYADATRLGSDSAAPYTYTWSGAAEGTHTLSAVAIDDELSATSTSIDVVISPAAPGDFAIEDVRLGDPDVCYINPELSDDSSYMVWAERIHKVNDAGEGIVRMWHCAIDPGTGDFIPADCKGFTGFDSTNWGRAYVGRDSQGVFYLGANENYQLTMTRITGATSGQTTVLGSLVDPERRAVYPSVLPGSSKIYVYWLKSHGAGVAPRDAEWVELRYADIDDPDHEIVIDHQENLSGLVPMDVTFPRWAFHQPLIVYGKADDENHVNIFQFDVSHPQTPEVQLTNDQHVKGGPYPVLFNGQRYIISAMDRTTELDVYAEPAGGGIYQVLEKFAPPPNETFPNACLANSPEPFIKDGQLYLSYAVTDCTDSNPDEFAFLSEPGEIWHTQLLDGSEEQWRVSRSSTDVKNEPEPGVGTTRAWIYYTSYPDGFDAATACNEVRRAATPVGF